MLRAHRATRLLVLYLFISSYATAQTSIFTIDIAGSATIEQLVDSATVIVEVHVESVFPPTETTPGRLRTDALLRVDRTLKGSAVPNNIVVSQRGGILQDRRQLTKQYSLMVPGERYILLLTPPTPATGVHPERTGLQRYQIMTEFVGLLRVDGDRILVSDGMPQPFRATNNNRTVSGFVSLIEERARSVRD